MVEYYMLLPKQKATKRLGQNTYVWLFQWMFKIHLVKGYRSSRFAQSFQFGSKALNLVWGVWLNFSIISVLIHFSFHPSGCVWEKTLDVREYVISEKAVVSAASCRMTVSLLNRIMYSLKCYYWPTCWILSKIFEWMCLFALVAFLWYHGC